MTVVAAESTETFKIDLPMATEACKRAQTALLENNLDLAIRHALAALASRPSCFMAYQILGKVLDKDGSPKDAVDCYRGRLPEHLIDRAFPSSLSYPVATDGYRRTAAIAAESNSMPAVETASGTINDDSNNDGCELVSPGCYVDSVPHGMVWHDARNTWLLNAQGEPLSDHTRGCAAILEFLTPQYRPVRLGKRAIVLGARGAHNYYHWTLDIIPKLGVLEAAGVTLREDDVFIVPFARQSFAQDLLSRFGIRKSQIFETEQVTPWVTADELLVPWLQNKMGLSMGAWLPRYMRRSVGNNVQHIDDLIAPGRKLFISRNSNTADGRTLGNQSEVEAMLNSYGFETVYPELLSVDEQAHLFGSAITIVAAHGAGLANLVYCSPGTTVIEFYGAHLSPCFRAICALAEFRYFNLRCAPDKSGATDDAGSGVRTIAQRRSAGFDVNLESAERLLQLADACR